MHYATYKSRQKQFSDKDIATKLAKYTYTYMIYKLYLVPLLHHPMAVQNITTA